MGKERQETTVVVGMSGGVDSSVTALLMKQQGYRVIGMFMRNWEEEDASGQCIATKDYEDVAAVCAHLDIPHYAVDFSKEYWDQVFAQTLQDLRDGYTPNPDILCNREIKFKVFLEKALALGADYLATGHYCRKVVVDGRSCLAKGMDAGKDQSYFLHAVKEEALDKVLFPLGGLPKSEVRAMAEESGLATAKKKDSTGICFIGKRNFRDFMQNYLPTSPGNFETLDGRLVGKHVGSFYYTIGQRKGLGIGGPGEPWFVVDKCLERNVVFVEQGTTHPALYSDELWAEEITWVSSEAPRLPLRCAAKVRYRQTDQACEVVVLDDGRLHVQFDVPQRAITPGQSVVFYDGDICLGGAVIREPGMSYHGQQRDLPLELIER
jgi:tRNA-specific 2-thiouridylase